MSFRFQRRIKILPGLNLNLSKSGVGLSVGVRGLRTGITARGQRYSSIGLPGTGLSWRHYATKTSSQPLAATVVPPLPPVQPTAAVNTQNISTLTSEALTDLHRRLSEARQERLRLEQEAASGALAIERYGKWRRGFLWKRILKASFARIKAAAEKAEAARAGLEAQIQHHLPKLTLDPAMEEPYRQVTDAFVLMSKSQGLWKDSRASLDGRYFTPGDTKFGLAPASFGLNPSGIVWDRPVPRISNRAGEELYFYPGFFIYRTPASEDFALIHFRDVMMTFNRVYVPNGPIPSATIHTRKHANKDGSMDHRFKDNWTIPVETYGALKLISRGGVELQYICSDAKLAEAFVHAWHVAYDVLSRVGF